MFIPGNYTYRPFTNFKIDAPIFDVVVLGGGDLDDFLPLRCRIFRFQSVDLKVSITSVINLGMPYNHVTVAVPSTIMTPSIIDSLFLNGNMFSQ